MRPRPKQLLPQRLVGALGPGFDLAQRKHLADGRSFERGINERSVQCAL